MSVERPQTGVVGDEGVLRASVPPMTAREHVLQRELVKASLLANSAVGSARDRARDGLGGAVGAPLVCCRAGITVGLPGSGPRRGRR